MGGVAGGRPTNQPPTATSPGRVPLHSSVVLVYDKQAAVFLIRLQKKKKKHVNNDACSIIMLDSLSFFNIYVEIDVCVVPN